MSIKFDFLKNHCYNHFEGCVYMRKKINHRIRYSEKDFVEKNYIKDGKAVIPI